MIHDYSNYERNESFKTLHPQLSKEIWPWAHYGENFSKATEKGKSPNLTFFPKSINLLSSTLYLNNGKKDA